ncbi:hypothetical protein V3528_21905, partial [Acinetobacter johnsonii]|uniref:hypothetical protein n=1 Tax=Acinetobacter johnsonii TaxID=40214 RepID=UPI0030F8F36C
KIQSLEESEINNTNGTQALIELHELLDNFIKFGNKRITIFRLDPKDLKLVKENLDTFTQSRTYSEDDFSIPDGISVNRE